MRTLKPMLKGIYFVVDENGKKTAVQIDLKRYRNLWEDFYDTLIATSRIDEPREPLEEVKQTLIDKRKFTTGNY